MVFLLNSLPIIILIVGAIIAIRFARKEKLAYATYTAAATVLLIYILMSVTPSYMPKGTVRDNPVVQFETVEIPTENRLRQARTEEEHDERLSKGLDWKQKAEQSKAEAEQKE